MTFKDSPVLGRFVESVSAISKSIDARQEEIRAAYARIQQLEGMLGEVMEFLEDRADADCDQNGFVPNAEMKLMIEIDETLHGPGAF